MFFKARVPRPPIPPKTPEGRGLVGLRGKLGASVKVVPPRT
jgi:hypothetical protein